MERHRDSDFFEGGEFKYPPDAWILTKIYKCSNCGTIVESGTKKVCPGCEKKMKMIIY